MADIDTVMSAIAPPPAASLLGLPPELRLKIYDYLFVNPGGKLRTMHLDGDRPRPGASYSQGCPANTLLLTCRLIHNEASPLLYGGAMAYILLVSPLAEAEESSKVSFAEMTHSHHTRKAQISMYVCAPESSSKLLEYVESALAALGYGAIFEHIHINLRMCCTRDGHIDILEAVMDVLGKLKCPGAVTAERWPSPHDGSQSDVTSDEDKRLRAKYAELVDTLQGDAHSEKLRMPDGFDGALLHCFKWET